MRSVQESLISVLIPGQKSLIPIPWLFEISDSDSDSSAFWNFWFRFRFQPKVEWFWNRFRFQSRASLVYGDYESDYGILLKRANMPTPELAQLHALCTKVFKCVNNLSQKYMCNLFDLRDKSIHNTRSAKSAVQKHSQSVKNGLKTFVSYSTHLWNNLPNNIKNTADLQLEILKSLIGAWMGPRCKCNFCKSMSSLT